MLDSHCFVINTDIMTQNILVINHKNKRVVFKVDLTGGNLINNH